MKNSFLLALLLLATFSHSQNSTKKIKETYVETTEIFNRTRNVFTEYDINGEPIAAGEWEFDETKTNRKKTATYKIPTEKEKGYQYAYDKNNNKISKTAYYKEGKYVKQFAGRIQYYEVLEYDHDNKLYKSIEYEGHVDTLQNGRDEINEDGEAYFSGLKNVSIENLRYDLNQTYITKYNNMGKRVMTLDLMRNEGKEFDYDEKGNMTGYTDYAIKNSRDMYPDHIRYFNWEREMFEDENIEGQYTVTCKYDSFGNWTERETLKGKTKFKKEIRYIVYF